MAYPVVSAPYGLKPVNLIGGQVFAGSTRSLPIQYGYSTNIFYGDMVNIIRGSIVKNTSTTDSSAAGLTGVFLGCSFTNPVTKQKTFSQYWPASTLAGDAMAIICDDPDTVFKVVICSATTAIASGSIAVVGQNLGLIQNAGNVNTGDSAVAALYSATLTTSGFGLRVVDIVRDTAVSLGTAVWTSTATATLTLASSNAAALPLGTDVASIAANGQLIGSGSFVATAAAAGATTVVLNVAPQTAFTTAATLVFTQYPEVLVKLNFGAHQYYTATAV
jgi:hypothetical protein